MAPSAEHLIFQTAEPAWAVDGAGRIVAWNEGATGLLGHPADRAVGARCWSLLGGRDTFGNQYCGRHCPLRDMAFAHQPVQRCRLHLSHASGDTVACQVTTLLIADVHGDESMVHLCRRDVDEPASPRPADLTRLLLTRREAEVLRHVADGRSTRDIALLLGISPSTVRNHVEHLFAKLDVHSRLAAVAAARRLGLLEG
jgi:DNA-binding CsgD family transcriptional regulator